MDNIKLNFLEAQKVLKEFVENSENFLKMEQAGKTMVDSLKNGGKIICCGNGGSMSDAMHFAEELTGRFRENRKSIAAIAISDPSHISCVANDFGYDYIFSRYLESVGNKGDILLGISTSGNSPNIIEAMKTARTKEMKTIGLTGKTGGKIAELTDVEIRAPKSNYSDRVQEIHIKIIHSLIDFIERNLE